MKISLEFDVELPTDAPAGLAVKVLDIVNEALADSGEKQIKAVSWITRGLDLPRYVVVAGFPWEWRVYGPFFNDEVAEEVADELDENNGGSAYAAGVREIHGWEDV